MFRIVGGVLLLLLALPGARAADDAKDTASVAKADYVEVAKLKGNKGAQNYELPEKADLDKYRVVSIWCNRFSVNFAAAPLTAPK